MRVCGVQKAGGDFAAMTLNLDFSFLCLSLTKLPIMPHKFAYLLPEEQKRASDLPPLKLGLQMFVSIMWALGTELCKRSKWS